MHNIYLKIIRQLPPELSHYLTINLLKMKFSFKKQIDDPSLYQHLFGLDFLNPLGMAAGFDKNVEVVPPLLSMGFGFVEAGTVTPKPQIGNDKPRIFRLNEDQAIINHLGFNNYGIDYALKKLSKLYTNTISPGIVGINIGANKNTEDVVEDYCVGLEKLGPFANYVAINISSPNTPGLRSLQNRNKLESLIKKLHNKKKEDLNLESKPLLLKISPDLEDEQLRDIALISLANGINGLIISNSTTDRPQILKSKNKKHIGGLSGKPLFSKSTSILKKIYSLTNGQIPLIGVGGITNGMEFYQKIKSGASLAQLYTALVFQGPEVILKIKEEIVSSLKTDGFQNIREAIGKDV